MNHVAVVVVWVLVMSSKQVVCMCMRAELLALKWLCKAIGWREYKTYPL